MTAHGWAPVMRVLVAVAFLLGWVHDAAMSPLWATLLELGWWATVYWLVWRGITAVDRDGVWR